ncbi:MAG TPA: dihydrolipoamide acetyltransferase family protein [Fimbriimonadaceae bacterium]|nr:dihydrolipoamide acetyltransferase family protein [Fimbriimonadaceae bacterium]
MTEVIMPKMGDGMEEGTLLEWLKKDGDKVKSGEVIGTIQTDKATLELEAPGTGTLSGLLLSGGETVPVGKAIAAILKEGESLPATWGSATAAASNPFAEPAKELVGAIASTAAAEVAQQATAGRVKASPLAKRVAKQNGVDLATVTGTGPGGRIVERDVLSAGPSPSKAFTTVTIKPAAEDRVVALNRIRQVTAKRTTESKQQVPHFYVTVEVDLEKIDALRSMFEEEESGKVSINDFIVKACAKALMELPVVNSTYQGDHVVEYGSANVGIAVALEEGLTVPVIKNADRLSLREISAASRDLAGRARDNKLSLDELSGSTFSISNMGMLNVENFVAIINQPNAAIVAVSSARKVAVVNDDDELEVRRRMNISGSFDHRVVDGAIGAKFMNIVRDYLENPSRLLS